MRIAEEIVIEAGEYGDAQRLAGFHYRAGPVAGVVRVFVARHRERLAGVLVEALPLLASEARDRATAGRYVMGDALLRAALLNEEVRGIARVIVHPVFRGLGLAGRLVRRALEEAQTPHVEAFAAMGRVHPFFERAGMRAVGPATAKAGRGRVIEALGRMGLAVDDLCAEARWRGAVERAGESERAELKEALRSHCVFGRGGDWDALIAQARRRLAGRPVYYFWRRDGKHEATNEEATKGGTLGTSRS